MAAADRDEFLRSQKTMRLATVGRDGGGDDDGTAAAGAGQPMVPHVVPVWYRYSRGRFYVGTNTGTRKARNVRETGRVSFCIDVGVHSPDIYGVMGQGTARLILDRDRVRRIARRILLRYFETLRGNPQATELLDETDCIIEISPTRLSTWSY